MTTRNRLVLTADRVLTPEVMFSPGWVSVEDDRITGVGSSFEAGGLSAQVENLGPVLLVPGFVDIHSHGGGGTAFTSGAKATATVLATHRAHGTTAMVASLVTDTLEAIEHQIRTLAPLVKTDDLLGIHLEGPWLSPAHRGAHNPFLLRDPALAEIDRLIDCGGGTVRMVTLAPELTGGIRAVGRLTQHGVISACGHSDATYDQAQAAISAGATVATHLFNAQRALHHREPGLILALLDRAEVTVELIADGIHVHPAMLRHAVAAKPARFVLVTDAMAAAGSADGNYRLGPLAVQVRGGIARLADGVGALAGSTLTLDRAVRYAVTKAGIPLPAAVRAATQTPAELLGRADLGRIAPGARADITVLDPNLHVEAVMHCGRWQPPQPK